MKKRNLEGTEGCVSGQLEGLSGNEVGNVSTEAQHAEVVLDDVGDVEVLVTTEAQVILKGIRVIKTRSIVLQSL
jgi:hypothetical protein